MNELLYFLEDYIEQSFNRNGVVLYLEKLNQKDVKYCMSADRISKNFRMLAFESTDDNPIDVGINESNFLNDKSYGDFWIKGSYAETVFFLCCSSKLDEIVIEAIEVNKNFRGNGFGRMVVEGVENFASDNGFSCIRVKPFDSDAESFWEHMGYKWTSGYSLIKKI